MNITPNSQVSSSAQSSRSSQQEFGSGANPLGASSSFSRFHSSSGFSNSLFNLIRLLLLLLQGQRPNNDSGRTIHGTNGKDTLNGSAGNDLIKGYGGNDVLNGEAGNDRLEGGYGNDRLNGGTGNDLFVDDSGSNTFSGDAGNDTVRFGGRFADYDIIPYNIDFRNNNFRLTNKRTGDIQTVLNVENYQFRDQKLSADQLRSRIEPPELLVSPSQDAAIRDRFGVGGTLTYRVLDADRNKTLTAGDILVVSGGFTGGEISRQILNEADIAAINGTNNQDDRAKFEAARKKWQQNGINDYSYTLQRTCFCTPDFTRPVDLEIRNGQIESAKFSDTGEPLNSNAESNRITVDELFNTIETALDNNAEQVSVTYDPQYGYPTSIFIDRDSRIADEEVGFNVSNFQRDDPVFTTLAVGEEDGGIGVPIPPADPPTVTTYAVGEEDGGVINPPKPIGPPIATTEAVGEEDGGIDRPSLPPIEPPVATTKALGEEDGGIKPPRYLGPPIATTLAIGEEDGGGGIRPIPIEPPVFTTLAVGEEDGRYTS